MHFSVAWFSSLLFQKRHVIHKEKDTSQQTSEDVIITHIDTSKFKVKYYLTMKIYIFINVILVAMIVGFIPGSDEMGWPEFAFAMSTVFFINLVELYSIPKILSEDIDPWGEIKTCSRFYTLRIPYFEFSYFKFHAESKLHWPLDMESVHRSKSFI